MKYLIHRRCYANIEKFYKNVAKKYKHTYSKQLMKKNVDEAIDGVFKIEKELLRREPTIKKWKGLFMANTDKWYYAYTVSGDTIDVRDACHAQNMHEED